MVSFLKAIKVCSSWFSDDVKKRLFKCKAFTKVEKVEGIIGFFSFFCFWTSILLNLVYLTSLLFSCGMSAFWSSQKIITGGVIIVSRQCVILDHSLTIIFAAWLSHIPCLKFSLALIFISEKFLIAAAEILFLLISSY